MKKADDSQHLGKRNMKTSSAGHRALFYKSARAAGAIAVSLCLLSGPVVSAAAETSDDTETSTQDTSSLGFFEYTSNVTDAVSLMMQLSGEDIVLDTFKSAMNSDGTSTTDSPETKSKENQGLLPGVHSADVAKMQQRLMDLDYMEPDEPTDFYGPQTEYSLQLFQREHNLQVDGIAGASTLDLLYSEKAKPYTVYLEAQGTDVELLQERLGELGYFLGSPTGYFGPETEKAVKAFQERNGLFVDGKVGTMTREALFSESAKAAPKPEPTPTPTSKASSSSGKKTSTSNNNSGKKTSTGSSSGNKTSSSSHSSSTTRVPNPGSVSALLSVAQSQLGKPYVRGGKGPNTFDCSGLVYYALNQSGKSIGYMTSGGWANSSYPRVNKMSELRAGDIICFRGHVAIYIGGGMMIDASSSKGEVVRRSCTGSWAQRNFICGRRVL
ncbi:MAG: peptidoglycan-binding protein [Bacillota bacterium]